MGGNLSPGDPILKFILACRPSALETRPAGSAEHEVCADNPIPLFQRLTRRIGVKVRPKAFDPSGHLVATDNLQREWRFPPPHVQVRTTEIRQRDLDEGSFSLWLRNFSGGERYFLFPSSTVEKSPRRNISKNITITGYQSKTR